MEQAQSENTDTLLPEVEETPENSGVEEETQDKDEAGEDEGYKYANKYSSVEDLEKGYKEVTAKLREKQPPAPDEYIFDGLSEDPDFADNKDFIENIDLSEDPLLQAALPAFKKHNISQEAANDIVKAVLKTNSASSVNPEEELGKLGENADEVLNEVARWVHKFPKERQEALMALTYTAEGIKTLKAMKDMSGEKAVPAEANEAPEMDPQDLLDEAYKIKAETKNFESNTQAIARYEALTNKAASIQLKKKK